MVGAQHNEIPSIGLATHICCLLVIIYVMDISSQAKIGDLHHVVISHQNIPGSQIAVDTLWKRHSLFRDLKEQISPKKPYMRSFLGEQQG